MNFHNILSFLIYLHEIGEGRHEICILLIITGVVMQQG